MLIAVICAPDSVWRLPQDSTAVGVLLSELHGDEVVLRKALNCGRDALVTLVPAIREA